MRQLRFLLLGLLFSFRSFGIASITGPSSVCVGGTITLSDATSGGAWSSSAPSIASIGSTSGTVSGLTVGTVTITYTAGASTVTTTLTVNPLPSIFTITGGGHFCAGGTGVHIGLGFSQAGVTYQLFNLGAPVGSPIAGIGASLDFGLLTTAGTYTVIATTASGCSATMSGSATVSIDPGPSIFTITGGGGYCAGGTGVHIGLSGSQTGIIYQLYTGGAPVAGPMIGTGSTLDFGSIPLGGTYTIIASDPGTGCTAVMAGSATVTAYPLPAVHTITGPITACAGDSVHITLGSSDTGVTYTLDSAGIGIVTLAGTGGPLDFGYHFLTSYTIVATGAGGCTTPMGSVLISVSPIVIPSVSISGITVVPSGSTETYTEVSTNGGSSPTYQWMVNGTAAGVGTSYTYTPLTGDILTLCMHSSASCAVPATVCATDSIVALSTTALQTSVGSGIPCVFPNPANSNLSISVDNTAYSHFTITNSLGQMIKGETIGSATSDIDISPLSAGVYYLTIYGNTNRFITKFVKLN